MKYMYELMNLDGFSDPNRCHSMHIKPLTHSVDLQVET